jgi:hypothetical protein
MDIVRNLLDPSNYSSGAVERPLSSQNSCSGFAPLCFDRTGPLVCSSRRWTCSWARLFTQRLWTFGYAEQALANIFDALPAGFCAAIQTASDKLATLMRSSHVHSIADAASRLGAAGSAGSAYAAGTAEVPGHVTVGGVEGPCVKPDAVHSFLECLEDIWERDDGEGFIEFAFDPATQQRANVMLNSLTASIAGMHKEEVLARLAAHDAPISLLPLDFLCALLHQSLRAVVPSAGGLAAARAHTDVVYLRLASRRPEGPKLIRMETVKICNAQGQVTQVD